MSHHISHRTVRKCLMSKKIITLQEAIEYVDHELLTNRFHVTHYGGCAVLFNKDTFFPDVKVKSIYHQNTRREVLYKVMEETQAGSYRACYHVPLSFDSLPAATKHSQLYRCTSITITPRSVASERS